MIVGTETGTQVQFRVQFPVPASPQSHDRNMSTIVNRNGIWQARYTDANGKQHRTSTHIPVKGGVMDSRLVRQRKRLRLSLQALKHLSRVLHRSV